uniref:DUF4806 domain-containing protein n=1 Tax=Rhabditophanes sp. KR3021 TaxID=114890 RepID=A0AC35TU48_9BILA
MKSIKEMFANSFIKKAKSCSLQSESEDSDSCEKGSYTINSQSTAASSQDLKSDTESTQSNANCETKSTEIHSLVKNKVCKYLEKYDMGYFMQNITIKELDLLELPHCNVDDDQLFFSGTGFIDGTELEQKLYKNNHSKESEDYSLTTNAVLEKIIAPDCCSTCTSSCQTCMSLHAKNYFHLIVDNCPEQKYEKEKTDSLTYKTEFVNQFYGGMYYTPTDLLEHGDDIFENYQTWIQQNPSHREEKYNRALAGEMEKIIQEDSRYRVKSDESDYDSEESSVLPEESLFDSAGIHIVAEESSLNVSTASSDNSEYEEFVRKKLPQRITKTFVSNAERTPQDTQNAAVHSNGRNQEIEIKLSKVDVKENDIPEHDIHIS